jgi:predicted membrane protein
MENNKKSLKELKKYSLINLLLILLGIVLMMVFNIVSPLITIPLLLIGIYYSVCSYIHFQKYHKNKKTVLWAPLFVILNPIPQILVLTNIII